MSTKRIAIITTGGTISCTTNRDGSLSPSVSGQQLVDAIASRFPKGAMEFTVTELGMIDSSDMTFEFVDKVVVAVADALADETIDGVVVTHGTDTMEETAMAVDAFHADQRPVIFTGAQLAFDHPESDGIGNLFEAVVIGTDESARGIGALIVFGHAVIPVRGATKWHTSDLLAFATNAPEDPVRPEPLHAHPLAGIKVDIIPAYLGSDGTMIEAALAAGAQGLVIEGLGSGNVSPAMAAAIEGALAKDVPVVMATRVPRGDVSAVYGGAGGGADLAKHGVISAGCVHPAQARIILAVAIATGVHPQTLF